MRRFVLFLWLISIFTIAGQGIAQELTDDNTVRIRNDDRLFLWNPDTGDSREIPDFIYAPTGEWGVYRDLAPISLTYLETHKNLGGLPNDIWLVNLATGEETVIADQPDNAILMESVWEQVIVRDYIRWSPDGTQLAWSEMLRVSSEEIRYRIMVMDIETQQVRTLVDPLPEHVGMVYPQPIQWVESGILLSIQMVSNMQDSFILYDPATGDLLQTTSIEAGEHLSAFLLMEQGNRSLVMILTGNGDTAMIDLESGEQLPILSLPMAVSADNPAGSVQVALVPSGDYSFPYQWQFTTLDGQTFHTKPMSGFDTDRFAIAPDGGLVIFAPDFESETPYSERPLLIWHDGTISEVPFFVESENTDGYIRQIPTWGKLQWHFKPNAELTCDVTLEPRLIPGEQATVLPGDPNSLRWYPVNYASRVGSIPAGAIFTVYSGPYCSQDYNWWLVDYEGQVGWTAEGVDDTYWLEPIGK